MLCVVTMSCSYVAVYVESSVFMYLAGILTIILVCLRVAFNLYTHFVVYFKSSGIDYRRYGRWALVTGATDGIGKGIARELAKLGISIVLVSRNPEKLQRVAKEIESEFHVEAQCIAIDFTNADDVIGEEMTPSVYDVISNGIRDLEIGILVNNVGMGTKQINTFLEGFGDDKDLSRLSCGNTNLINCNDLSYVKLTQLVLPEMVKRGKGVIINVSSVAAQIVNPLGSIYSGSKRFVANFSNALSYEYEDKGIVVQCIQPGLVYTKLATSIMNFKPSFMSPDSKTFASHALKSVGKARMTNGYWLHAFQIWLILWIPLCLYSVYVKIFKLVSKSKLKNGNKIKDGMKKYK